MRMERLLLLLPNRPQPLTRYGTTFLIVCVSAALQYGLVPYSGHVSLFLFIPAIFTAGLAFDRGSGIFAAVLSVGFAAWQLNNQHDLITLGLFFLVGIAMAFASETLRKALEKSWKAEQTKGLLLEELSHRTKNSLAMVGSLLRLQARQHPQFEAELCGAANRVQVMADVHDFLRLRPKEHTVDMNRYISELCNKLGDTLRGVRPIAISVEAANVELPADRAVPIGIIVNELVTNSLKYAFPSESHGIITVTFREGDEFCISVEDNGVGCSGDAKGMGTTLINLMTNQLHGTFKREDAGPGCRSILKIKN